MTQRIQHAFAHPRALLDMEDRLWNCAEIIPVTVRPAQALILKNLNGSVEADLVFGMVIQRHARYAILAGKIQSAEVVPA